MFFSILLDVGECPVDFLSAGGHKWLLGPIGTGFFYCRRDAMEHLRPHNVGYHSVAKDADHLDYELTFRPDVGRFEEALVNFPGLWGLEAAVDLILTLGTREIEKHLLDLTDHLIEGLLRKECRIASSRMKGERSGIVTFHHRSMASETLHARLQDAGIDVALCMDALRASPSVHNDEDDIDRLIEAIP